MAPLRTAFLSAFCALLSVGIASPAQSVRRFDVHAHNSPELAAAKHTESVRRPLERRTTGNGTCPIPTDIPVRASKTSPFLPLTNEDFGSVVDWLFQPEQNLNLTSVSNENLTQTDNYIWLIEALHPNKTDILNYLDRNSTKPRKYARVVINEGGKEIPDATEYFVGPLPIDNTTTIQTLDYIYTGSPHIPFNARFEDGPRSTAIDSIVAKTMSSIADITKDLMEIEYYGQSDERSNCQYFVSKPSSGNGSQSIVWLPWRINGIAPYDQMMDFYASFDISGTDESLYTFRMFVYNNVVFTSVQQFREAWESGKIIKSPVTPLDESHLRKDRIGDFRELETRFAPTTVELDGKRYKVDEENRYVEYLGWSFYTGFTRDVGIQFFDIKFKGERVIYELSLQDAIAQYAGNNPFQAGTAYNDRFYGIGALMGRLIPGYDCPYHATYWNSTIHGAESTDTNINSICIFETDIGHPITRHSAGTYKQATKGSALVVRVVATVGNYDYLWDYTFMTDGAIGVDARASGYVQANYYKPEDEDHWGPRIAETITGTLHTHVMNFKVDFDIVDDKNSFVKTDLIIENITQPWYPERGTFEMARLNFTELQTEDEGLLPATAANGQTMYTIQNNAHKNKWGVPRGYRIVPGVSNVHLPSMLSPWFLKSGQYAKQAMAVSRQHDTEPYSSAALNQNLPEAPLVEFWSFFNGESLQQEDLVVWINLGMHHYTRSEDLPNTLMSEAHSSVVFAPQNWGNAEGTRDLANAVIYNKGDGDVTVPFTNGVYPPSCFALSPEDKLLGVFENGSA